MIKDNEKIYFPIIFKNLKTKSFFKDLFEKVEFEEIFNQNFTFESHFFSSLGKDTTVNPDCILKFEEKENENFNKIILFVEFKDYSKVIRDNEDLRFEINRFVYNNFLFIKNYYSFLKTQKFYFLFSWINFDNEIKSKFVTAHYNSNSQNFDFSWKIKNYNFKNHYFKEILDISKISKLKKPIKNNDISKIFDHENFDSSLSQNPYIGTLIKKILKDFNCKKEVNFYLEGKAGSGKTFSSLVLFSYFLKKNEDVYLFMLNKSFSEDIKEIVSKKIENFNQKRIFHRTLDLSNLITTLEKDRKERKPILIIDECQRLSISLENSKNKIQINNEDIKKIFSFFNVIFSGDENQKLNSYEENFSLKLLEKLLENKISIKKVKLEKSLRTYSSLIKLYEEITIYYSSFPEIFKKVKEIDWKNHEENLFEVYQNLNDMKSNMNSLEFKKEKSTAVILSDYEIEGKNILGKNWFNFNYLNNENQGNFNIWNEFHLISREVENLHLILPTTFDIEDLKLNKKQRYRLYILLTRATKKIFIYAENKNTYNYFSNIKNLLKEKNKKIT